MRGVDAAVYGKHCKYVYVAGEARCVCLSVLSPSEQHRGTHHEHLDFLGFLSVSANKIQVNMPCLSWTCKTNPFLMHTVPVSANRRAKRSTQSESVSYIPRTTAKNELKRTKPKQAKKHNKREHGRFKTNCCGGQEPRGCRYRRHQRPMYCVPYAAVMIVHI